MIARTLLAAVVLVLIAVFVTAVVATVRLLDRGLLP